MRPLYIGTMAVLFVACSHDEPPVSGPETPQDSPPAPRLTDALQAKPIAHSIAVIWRPVEGATEYSLYWGTDPNITKGTATKISQIFGTSYTFADLDPTNVYYFFVTAVNEHGEGPPSQTLAATPFEDMEIRINIPGSMQLQGPQARVSVVVQSLYLVSGVTASVHSKSTTLTVTTNSRFGSSWNGSLSLQGLPRGALAVMVEVTDAAGNRAVASRGFYHDSPPVVTILAPDSWSVAHPDIRAAATCEDDHPNGCDSIIISPGYHVGHHALDLQLTFNGSGYFQFHYLGFDSAGQDVQLFVPVYADSSRQISEVSAVPALIMDFDAGRILFRRDSALTIRDLASATDQIVFDSAGWLAGASASGSQPYWRLCCHLTPGGAIFWAYNAELSESKFFEWRNGMLAEFAAGQRIDVFRLNGRFAVWGASTALRRRDLVSGVDEALEPEIPPYDFKLGPNGDVVWHAQVGQRYQILRRRASIEQLTFDTDADNLFPVTDGINVVFQKRSTCCSAYVLAAHSSLGEERLTPDQRTDIPYSPPPLYLANNGWIAYLQHSATGPPYQVWIRSPSGEKHQQTIFANTSALETMGPNGDVAFFNRSDRYLARPGSTAPQWVNSDLGHAVVSASDTYVVIGGVLFRVNP